MRYWWAVSRLADHLERAATRTHQQGGGELQGGVELHQALDCLHGCEELPQEHINKVVVNYKVCWTSPSAWLSTWLWRAATRTHQQGGGELQGGVELHQALDCLHDCGCQWRSLRQSAVSSSISLHLHLVTNKPALLRAEDRPSTLETLRNGGRLGWNSISLSISDIFQ